jgi:hypothetical protein
MYFNVISAEYENGYTIRLAFEDGSEGSVDLSDYPDPDTVFKSFADLDYFKKFRVEHGTIVWGNGELDIAPETLYRKATGKEVIYSSQRATV